MRKKFIIYMLWILGLGAMFSITGCSGQIGDGKLVSIIEEKTEFNEVEMDSVEVLSDIFLMVIEKKRMSLFYLSLMWDMRLLD